MRLYVTSQSSIEYEIMNHAIIIWPDTTWDLVRRGPSAAVLRSAALVAGSPVACLCLNVVVVIIIIMLPLIIIKITTIIIILIIIIRRGAIPQMLEHVGKAREHQRKYWNVEEIIGNQPYWRTSRQNALSYLKLIQTTLANNKTWAVLM